MGAERFKPGDPALDPDPGLRGRGQVERALHESEERFRRLAEASYEGIAIVDGELVVDANPQAAALLGYDLSEYIGKSVSELIAPESWEAAAEHKRSMDKRPWEGMALHKNGSRVLVEVRARVIRAGERTLRVAIFRDVGERRAMEQRLRDTEKMQVIGRLAGSVAHDFNNLLTIILGCAHLIENNLEVGDPSRELATEITAAGERAAGLTRQLLSFARRQAPDLRVLDVNEVIRGMAQMLERLLGPDIKVTERLGAIPPVRADPGHIEQVLMNLCTNGRDAMPDGGELSVVTEVVDVESGAEPPPGRWVHLVVADHGVGMDTATLARAFEPLFTTKEVGRGTGLGLSTVQAVVAQSGGHLSIVSEVDRGTTAHIWLPALKGDPRIETTASREALVPRGTETVMLVEDEPGIRSLVDGVLRSLGYSVIVASAGEAERVARSHAGPLDLLVSDVVMPGMGGPSVAALVRALRPAVRVLYISGHSDDVLTERAGGAAFLSKPFTPSDLARKVREVLGENLPPPARSPLTGP
jgi:two-component system cell cycle sensor histidine kinase/response regulator CckA